MTRHTFGGSAMDRYVYDYEVPEGGGDAPVEAAPETPAAAEAEAPVLEASTPWAPDAPEFLEAVDQRASELFDTRLNALLQQDGGQQQPQDPTGEMLDLNPLDENFGTNLLTLLAQRDQFMVSQMQQMFQPVLARNQQDLESQGNERVNEIVSAFDIGDPGKEVVKILAPALLGETERLYGNGTAKAAESALQKAGALITKIEQDAFKRGQAANATHLNAISGANQEPGTSGGAVSQPSAGSVDEALERWQSRNSSTLAAA